MSCRDDVVEVLNNLNLPTWLLDVLMRATKSKGKSDPPTHVFCMDFASALLANILHSYQVLDSLEKKPFLLKDIITRLLNMLKEQIPTSVLVHILICLSYLSKERFC